MAKKQVYYKEDFLKLAEQSKMLRFGSFVLKSGRRSPYFFNLGDVSDGETMLQVGRCYADCIAEKFRPDEFNVLFGPAYKGISLATATAMALAETGVSKGFNYNRKEAKSHGEAGVIVGRQFRKGDRILVIDDVFTTGDTKQEMIDLVRAQCPEAKIVGIVIGLDRRELDLYGENAISNFREKQGIRVESIASVTDLILNEHYPQAVRDSIREYTKKFGIDHNPEAPTLIPEHRSVMPALDFPSLLQLEELLKATGKMPGIGAYKTGFSLAYRYGLPKVTELIRKYSDKPIIHDGQKAGTDIPDTGEDYAEIMRESGVNGAILFPLAGPKTQERWTAALWSRGIIPVIGGEMTHPRFKRSEGGYIDDGSMVDMYVRGAQQGVRYFIAPGNKTDRIAFYRAQLQLEGIAPIFSSPGFIAQSDLPISKVKEIAGPRFHAVVGRGIYEAEDMGAAAERLVREIKS